MVVAAAAPACNVDLPLQVNLPALRIAPRKARIPQHGDLSLLHVVVIVEAVANLHGRRGARRRSQAQGQGKQARGDGAAHPLLPRTPAGRMERGTTHTAVLSGFLFVSAHGKHG
ncbi:hypothetical protein D9M72_530610 [compost metagenome]